MKQNIVRPKGFTIQWHITEKCNLRCKHCYQEGEKKSEDLSLNELFQIFDNCLSLNLPYEEGVSFHISGGEPMIRNDFFKFIEKIGENSKIYGYKWRMLSNGLLLTDEKAKRLKELGIAGFQVSIEGLEKNNDDIRGKGSFKKTIEGIRILIENRINVSVSLTLTRKNINEVISLAEILNDLGVRTLGPRRLVPTGDGLLIKNTMIDDPEELKNFYLEMMETNKKFTKQGKKIKIFLGCETAIFNSISLSDDEFGKFALCGVTTGRGINIMSNGDFVPCRRMPIVVGNALKDNAYDVYYSEKMKSFRDTNNLHSSCKSCANLSICLGGAKCITYACNKKWELPDPQCWTI